MAFSPADLLLAWVLDAVFGDPAWLPWPHPVALMGRAAARIENRLRAPGDGPAALVAKGALLWLTVVLGATATGAGLLVLAGRIHPLFGHAVSVYLAYASLATRSLDVEARAVADRVRSGDLVTARQNLSRIVGRDTDALPPREILRATVETVAENSSDGIVAPLFYLCLGGTLGWGPLLALAYKAVNTLDSTVGYRNERYEHLGKVSARIDDAANWIPARGTALLAAAAAELLWGTGRRSLRMAHRDGGLHKSPNSGYPEAAFAGALGIRIGGTNLYHGIPRPSPLIGDPGPDLSPLHVYAALRLLWALSLLAVAAGVATLTML